MKSTLPHSTPSTRRSLLAALACATCSLVFAQPQPTRTIGEFVPMAWSETAKAFSTTDWPSATGQEQTAILDFAHALLAATEKTAPDQGASVRRTFQESPNYLVRMVGNASEAFFQAGKVPMQMKFTAVDGRAVDLEAMRGKVVLIDFRGITHCGACEADEPHLKEVYDKYHDQGFEIISICDDMVPYAGKTMEQAKEKVQSYIAAHKLPWPTYFDGLGYSCFNRAQVEGTAPANPFFKMFDVGGTPTYFLIGKNGLVIPPPFGPPPELSHMYVALPGTLEWEVRSALGL